MTLNPLTLIGMLPSLLGRTPQARLAVVKVVELPPADCGLQHSIIRVHNMHIDSKRSDVGRFFRRDLLMIINPANGEKTLRYAMGNPGGNGLSIKKHEIAVDYDAVATLGVRFNREVELVVRRATTMEIAAWFYMYPDLGIRWSYRLGILGGLLGVVGLFMGLLPFLLS
ncbi:hypothetical protein L4Z68_001430 [Pseudomonas aeruginosa]